MWSIELPVLAKGARPLPAEKDPEGAVPPFPIHGLLFGHVKGAFTGA